MGQDGGRWFNEVAASNHRPRRNSKRIRMMNGRPEKASNSEYSVTTGYVGDNSTPDADERAFNETLKRMLRTPPKPHDDSAKQAVSGKKKAG